jgi:hypothetical protein
LPAERDRPFDDGFTHRCRLVDALCVVARNRSGGFGKERRHAFLGAVGRTVCVAAWNAEREAVAVVATWAADASAETLIRGGEETGEAVRAN